MQTPPLWRGFCMVDISGSLWYTFDTIELVDNPHCRQFFFFRKCNAMERMETDQQFLEFVVKAIVNNPDDVKVSRIVDERGVLLTLDISPGDMGYVIGRQGQTARAIRTLLKIVGAKNNARVNLKINEPEGGKMSIRSGSSDVDKVIEDLKI